MTALLTFTLKFKVSTQGYPTPIGVKVPKKDKCWVESYTLAFSTDGSQWQQYTENGSIKVCVWRDFSHLDPVSRSLFRFLYTESVSEKYNFFEGIQFYLQGSATGENINWLLNE